FPDGVAVAPPVTVKNNTATVDFGANAASTREPALGRMLRQLQASLQNSTITGVAMTARGAPLPVPDTQVSQAQPAVAVNPAPLLLKGKQFGFYPGLQSLAISDQVVAL